MYYLGMAQYQLKNNAKQSFPPTGLGFESVRTPRLLKQNGYWQN